MKEELETPKGTDEGSRDIMLSEEEEDDEGSFSRDKASYFHVPYGFQGIGCYKHASKNCEIGGVTYNNRFRQFVILDSRGINSWSYESLYSTVTRHLNYPAYQFNVLRMIIFSRKFNVYFALSKEHALKVFNLNFHEVISVSAEMHSVLCMVFNPGRNELITGGTGGMKFWRFGDLTEDKRKSFSADSRPMANYGLVLRDSYPKMGGSWVKHVELDVAMQRLYCLSERNVVAYDMIGNELFQVNDAHRGPVTGCVYSKSCNLLVTTGNDCDVNIWSRSGGLVQTFSSHTKVITNIMIHPEAPGVVVTASMDGMVKMFSLDIMEEIYSLPVFHEGIHWMDLVSPKIMYCCSNRQIEVFALNHVLDFWALSRCGLRSLSLVTCAGKSSRVMAVGCDSSVRLLSRVGKTLSTVLPPPSISPLTEVIDVAYSREFNIMYLLIDRQEIWVYYTRTNPATRLEAWQLDYVEDIHTLHSTDHSNRSRTSIPWTAVNDGQRSPGSKPGGSFAGSPRPTTPWDGSSSPFLDSAANPNHDRVSLACLGMLYSNIIIESVEGPACPDATHFLLAGTEDGRVLFLHMFSKGLKYAQLKVHKGLILGIEHDQVTNTLVAQCRATNGIDVQFWSLPTLTLMQQITCQSDVTCHVRMNEVFLSGHESGYIGIHCLDDTRTDGDVCTMHEGKRLQSRDHQGPINSIDTDKSLEMFCTSSTDGFLRLWNKTKTLLREIYLDDSLTCARFLNNRGDVLIGFKQHIFFISHTKVLPSKELPSGSDDGEDESFETESDIYEDPSVRYEGRKILQPDPTNMENYLVPFPNLNLKTSFFMEGRPPPDLHQQDLQEHLESLSSMSDTLSLAPTDIYYSPNSTPRSMSLSSGPVVGRRDSSADEIQLTNNDVWKLPDFGDSPVSSPPRTPPPEPTPPPTPPPEELSDEDQENNAEQQEPTDKDTPSCEECNTLVKTKEKKTTNFPSVKREGGRLSNMRIDSKSLRGSSGPGYAAPVVRPSVQIPEPKQFKPRRPPRITKKAKKLKENTEESQKEQPENPTESNDPNNPINTGTNTTVKGSDTDGLPPGPDREESLPSSAMNAARGDGSNKQGGLQSVEGSVVQGSRSSGPDVLGKGKEVQGLEKGRQNNIVNDIGGSLSEGRTLQEPDQNGSPQQKRQTESNVTQPDEDAQAHGTQGGDNEQNIDNSSGKNDNYLGEHVKRSQDDRFIHTNVHGGAGDFDEQTVRVVYVDPDTGESFEGTLADVPKGAKIIAIVEDSEQDNIGASAALLSKQNKRPKSVTFKEDSKINKSIQKGQDFGGDTLRSQRGRGLNDRTYVVPSEDTNPDLQEDLVIKGLPRDNSVSPLTIFALARSRKTNAAKQARRVKASSSDYPMYSPDKNYIHGHGYDTRTESSNLKGDSLAEEDVARSSSQLSATQRPRSSKKHKDDVVKWCINALRKSNTHLYIPEKPNRTGSSVSERRDVAMWVNKPGTKEGETLFINVPEKTQRPNSTATYHSIESTQEFSTFPYKGLTGIGDDTNEQRQSYNTRARTAPPGRRRTDIQQMGRSNIHESTTYNDGYYTDFFRFRSPDERPVSSLDFPSLYVADYSGNWQEIVLARARLLKKQRLERQKSAKERRKFQHDEQKVRWKKTNHLDCAKGENDKPEPSLDFVATLETNPQQTRTTPQDDALKQLKEQELSSDQPFRLRIHPRQGSARLTRPARSLMTVISNDHTVEDIARAMPRPKTAASIPNKCSRFVLVSGNPTPSQEPTKPTKIEQTLMMTRFPKYRGPKKHWQTIR